ncbi:MAG: DUF4382 domain-containing protein [candidate division Zixibacteria bacterium]|nr:DUF4382 domain-containing protein [candidate division Zixibacteria bacterium]
MRRRKLIMTFFLFPVCVAMVFYLFGCGSGGGGGSVGGATDQAGAGTVSVLLTDGPADEFERILIRVTEVSLIPVDGNPVILFQSQEGYEVDLLELEDEDFLLTVKKDVPARLYEKVRLRISEITVEGGPCTDMEIKLPSGKIDLNPREPFEVITGGTLLIRLDIDANKSINLHPAGQSGKCIFRPVVFVEIQSGELVQACPQILDGNIVRLIDEEKDGEIEGFILDLSENRGELEVRLSSETVIWDEFGNPSGSDVLEVGKRVNVRGRLGAEGRLHASVVLVGDIFEFEGTVSSDVEDNIFLFTPDPGTGLLSDADVEVLAETLILVGCDDPVGLEEIKKGMHAKIFGWISGADTRILIRAVAVLLGPGEISGDVTSLQPLADGYLLTVVDEEGTPVDMFLPLDVPIFLEGDGPVPIELLCEGQKVHVLLDPDEPSQPTATEVQVESEMLTGKVNDVDENSRILRVRVVEDETVYVRPEATILDLRGDVDTLVSLGQVEVGDELEIFGLPDCSGGDVFHGFVVLIVD